ncbi:MAG: translocation/assembly module TamB domain-containing protein [Burkholderiales bacterium]|nr:translocation/assembly module TamB domain-containing protein [Burkholderiales bacterium]
MAGKKLTFVLRAAAAVVLLCALLVVSVLGWLSTPQARDWVAARIVAANPGRIVLEQVGGSLLGELRIGRLHIDGNDFTLEGESITLDWRPAQLLLGRVSLRQLRAQSLSYSSRSTAPAVLPESLTLPFALEITTLEIGRLQLQDLPEIRDLRLAYAGDGAAHHVDMPGIRMGDCSLDGKTSIAAHAPFAVEGSVVASCDGGKLLDARTRISGSLEALQLALEADGLGAKAQGLMRLSPFSPQPLRELDLSAQDIDPRLWRKDLPHARLSLRATAAPQGEHTAGTLDIDNTAAGSIDKGRIPVTGAKLRWSLSGGRYLAESLTLALSGGGRVDGKGHWQPGTETGLAELRLAGIDARRIDGRLKPLRVNGQVSVRGNLQEQGMTARLEAAGARLDASVRHADGRLVLEQGLLRAGQGEARLSGHLEFDGAQAYALRAQLRRFDPAAFAAVPPARFSGLVTAEGSLAPSWQASIVADLSDSSFRGRPFAASADFTASATRWFDGRARVVAGRNRLELDGRYGRAPDTLNASVVADDLSGLDPGWGGRLRGKGTLSVTADGPLIDVELDAVGLSIPALRVAEAGLRGSLAPGADGLLRMNLDARKLQWSGRTLERLQLSANGTRARHNIEGHANGKDLSLALAANGGLDPSSIWRGTLIRLDNGAPWTLRLTAPAAITAGPAQFSVDGLRAAFLGGSVGPLSLRWTPEALRSEGTFQGIAIAPLLPRDTVIESQSLRIGGTWSIDATETLDGRLTLRREAGDLAISGTSPIVLALRGASVDVRARGSEIDAVAEVDSAIMGTARLQAQSRLLLRAGQWVIPGDSPLTGKLSIALRSLTWTRALVPGFDRIDGALTAEIEASGSIAAPRLTGNLAGERIALRAIGAGIDLRDGRLRASLDGRRLLLQEFEIRAGQGRITASGNAELDSGLQQMELQVRAERARILFTPQWSATVSGGGKLGLRDQRIAIEGQLTLDEGRYDLGNRMRPTLGDDVVVRAPAGTSTGSTSALPMHLDVSVDLNDRMVLRGNGLDALLGGTVRVRSQAAGLTATGAVRTVRGTYQAYNQNLAIERGTVTFGGLLTNPALDLRAMRKFATAEVGVEIGGSLQRPQVRLVSTPDMSDSDRLGWLVLGRDPQNSDGAQLALLQAAALSLVGGSGKPLTGQIAEGTGLDELGFAGGEGEALGVVTLGKRLTDRLSIRLEQTLGGTAGSLLRVDFLLSERWRLRGTAGAENAGDILFTWRFD